MNNWQTKKLGELAEYLNGYPFKPTDWVNSGLPIIRIQNLNDENKEYHYFNGNIGEKYRVRKGDILISWSASLGSYIWDKDDAWLNQHIFKVLVNENEVNRDFFYFLSMTILEEMKRKTHGGTMKHITKNLFENIQVQLPPLSIQQQIVERLDAIRKLQELNNKEIEKTEEMFDSLIKQQLALRENLVPLIEIAEINPAVNIDKSKPIPFISMADVDGNMGRVVNISYKENSGVGSGSRFENGDVLFARITPCTENGKTALLNGLNTSGMGSTEFYVLRAKKDKAIPYFIYLLTRTDWFRQQAVVSMTGTSGRQRVPKSFFENVLIPSIPLSKQKDMQIMFSKIQEYQMIISARKDKLSELFESALNKAMKGELVS